ncbi:ThyA Thymidylate synthase [uncultured Caudovirales phage]|uniref:ThyA Thymidylate synthase n=1 Tax=uncultured Caudovirales phage TaxID=2100421 RepID=A0A6J7WUK0_9CAUD|nr:ThyA Thymidylate synthase [uncultured Caudovirales phage]
MNMMSIEDIRRIFMWRLQDNEFVTDKSGVKMLEIMNASFVADQPAIFGKVNEDYVRRELEWYESMSLNVNDIPGGPPAIWQQVATENGEINSNYGWCIWSDDNWSQYDHVVAELQNNPESRRANMIYTRPSMWHDYNLDGMSDFMCTNNVQYMIRHGALHALVYMRSNDVVFGYKNDYAWQKHVQLLMSEELGVAPGNIYWNVGSLHVYERHFDLVL